LAPTGWFLCNFMLGSSFTSITDHIQVWCTWDRNYRHFKCTCLYIYVNDFDNGDSVLYQIWAEAEETADKLKITNETGCVLCEVSWKWKKKNSW
jgi:hypothetical protein